LLCEGMISLYRPISTLHKVHMSIIYVLYNYFDILPMDDYNVKVSSATDRIVLSCVCANVFKLELGIV